MNPALWFLLLMILVIVLTQREQDHMAWYLRMKSGKDRNIMTEAARQLIGKKCYFYMLKGELTGIIREVQEHSVTVEAEDGMQVINLDFVMRIREIPEKKKKRKSAEV